MNRPRLTIRLRVTLLCGAASTAATAAALGSVCLWMFGLFTQATRSILPEPPTAAPVPPEATGTFPDTSAVLGDMLRVSGLMLLVSTLGALAIGWILAGRILAPIRRITLTAAGISAGNLNERLALRGPDDEIKELADAFDGMLTRLQPSFDGYRRFAAHASHELRTPLATSQTLIDVAAAVPWACDMPTLLADLTEINVRSEQTIDALLEMARAEHGIRTTSAVDLADLARYAIMITAPEASKREISVAARLDEAPVTGDPVLLDQLTVNLLTNAIRHNEPYGRVSVTVTTDREYAAVLTVRNTGPVVPSHQLDQLFEPFTRSRGWARESRHDGHQGGHGLGLAIVQAVVTAHHGVLTTTANPTGGLTVSIRLPLFRSHYADCSALPFPNTDRIPAMVE